MDAEKLMEVLAVDPETPLLKGIMCVLAGREEVRKEEAAALYPGTQEQAYCAGRLFEAIEAQEDLLALVKKAREGAQS